MFLEGAMVLKPLSKSLSLPKTSRRQRRGSRKVLRQAACQALQKNNYFINRSIFVKWSEWARLPTQAL